MQLTKLAQLELIKCPWRATITKYISESLSSNTMPDSSYSARLRMVRQMVGPNSCAHADLQAPCRQPPTVSLHPSNTIHPAATARSVGSTGRWRGTLPRHKFDYRGLEYFYNGHKIQLQTGGAPGTAVGVGVAANHTACGRVESHIACRYELCVSWSTSI